MITMNLKDLPEELTEEEKKMLERAEKGIVLPLEETIQEIEIRPLMRIVQNLLKNN